MCRHGRLLAEKRRVWLISIWFHHLTLLEWRSRQIFSQFFDGHSPFGYCYLDKLCCSYLMTSFERLLSKVFVCLFRLIVVAGIAIEREKLAIFFPAREARYSRQSKHNGPQRLKKENRSPAHGLDSPRTLYYYYHFPPSCCTVFWVLYYIYLTILTEIWRAFSGAYRQFSIRILLFFLSVKLSKSRINQPLSQSCCLHAQKMLSCRL